MTLSELPRARDLRAPLDELIATHGLLRVTGELLRAALRRGRNRPPPVDHLSEHLRRDIGLDPAQPRISQPWELR
ncbi:MULTISPECIES: hypothetical protein [unclassified Paracoccus (in: a-proteobacteria)]|uniref:hypothetical protein n=1 Tax=unclassified Paracoccus (in: a-proteobacteria) TaxID=2688777 RepID=UPI0012B1AC7A|nr:MULTISPECIES: hypothetical protein [unclassified Paracoccus (in: a-proteobacteria)]UXU73989.1 hypothetical protein GB879_008645 [Paracoccus sp. SMMA_5]UXU79877.1 hypothetical protein GB880_008625 [Paracoccus sp. SMMA_5_TC]